MSCRFLFLPMIHINASFHSWTIKYIVLYCTIQSNEILLNVCKIANHLCTHAHTIHLLDVWFMWLLTWSSQCLHCIWLHGHSTVTVHTVHDTFVLLCKLSKFSHDSQYKNNIHFTSVTFRSKSVTCWNHLHINLFISDLSISTNGRLSNFADNVFLTKKKKRRRQFRTAHLDVSQVKMGESLVVYSYFLWFSTHRYLDVQCTLAYWDIHFVQEFRPNVSSMCRCLGADAIDRV